MTTPLTDRDKAHILEQRANKENGKYRCLDCGEVKTLENFYKTKLDNGRLKVTPHCKACKRKKKQV